MLVLFILLGRQIETEERMKYGNSKVAVGGKRYDSKREAGRAAMLRLMASAGSISDLREQVRYTLIPSQYVNGKCVERSVMYIADFVYVDNATGETVVEDTKGFRTKDYIIKRKLMLWVHGIQIREV